MADYLDTLDAEAVLKASNEMRAHHPELIEQAGGSVRLALFLQMVDRRLMRLVGITHRDLVDFCWADALAAETSPREAAMAALENDDMFGELALSI